MRFERSKEWWLARSRAETEVPIGAGVSALADSVAGEQFAATGTAPVEPLGPARFGEFVHLMRRHRGLSIEQFADAANIDVSEAQVIEEDFFYYPEPRTIYYVAKVFDLSQQRLNELVGLTVANEYEAVEGQQRYAARSESRSRLNGAELVLLNAIVAALEDRAARSHS